MPIKESPGATTAPGPTTTTASNSTAPQSACTSRQVNWLTVHNYVEPTLKAVGSWPMVGTPEWVQAPTPIKLASIFDAARHWALRIDINQCAMAEASHDVSAAADWKSVAMSRFRHRNAPLCDAHIAREAVA
jgi:hypothetical protein